MDQKLTFTDHTTAAVKKANKILGIMFRTFSFMDEDMFTLLYKSLVRPNLEYCTPVCSPISKKDKISIENVQRRATKRLKELRQLTYNERLRRLGLPTLEYRRERADMIQLFKIIEGIDIVDINITPRGNAQPETRGHSKKLYKRPVRLNISKHTFSNRVVNPWNSLNEETVQSSSVNIFKNNLNKLWKHKENKFEPTA